MESIIRNEYELHGKITSIVAKHPIRQTIISFIARKPNQNFNRCKSILNAETPFRNHKMIKGLK